MEDLSMAQNSNKEASAIFGTSSDAILQGLANGDFTESPTSNPDDKNQIVNQQEQQEIVNPVEEKSTEDVVDKLKTSELSKLVTPAHEERIEDQQIADDGIEDEPEE